MTDSYFKYWNMYTGKDFKDLQTGKLLTKGQFYRLHTEIAEDLATGVALPERFTLVERPPFVPYLCRDGIVKKEKQVL